MAKLYPGAARYAGDHEDDGDLRDPPSHGEGFSRGNRGSLRGDLGSTVSGSNVHGRKPASSHGK